VRQLATHSSRRESEIIGSAAVSSEPSSVQAAPAAAAAACARQSINQ